MTDAPHIKRGTEGEALATAFLVEKGFRILDRNWRFQRLEIDIVAIDGEELVIVEVKTRKKNDLQLPRDLIPLKKQKYLIEAADAYIRQNVVNRETRFDVIIIHTDGTRYSLEHIPRAFYPTI